MRDYDPTVDYYEVLQVHPKAQPEIIKRAYRTLLREMKAHPDLGGDHATAVRINEAYEVLSDPGRRAAYDLARAGGSPPGSTQAAPPPPRTPPGMIVACPTCGRKNRVPSGISTARARCGSCGGSLSGAPAQPPADRGMANRFHLSQQLYNELCANSQVELRVDRLRRGGRIVCRRCRQPWVAAKSITPPAACPSCGAKGWNSFRLFKCRHCGHEFRSGSLRAYPYLVHPRCPACQAPNWNKTCERSWLRKLLSLFLKG